MIKKAPTDEQLKETVQSLLKEANLEEMTMKQICQRVRSFLLFTHTYKTETGDALTESKFIYIVHCVWTEMGDLSYGI